MLMVMANGILMVFMAAGQAALERWRQLRNLYCANLLHSAVQYRLLSLILD